MSGAEPPVTLPTGVRVVLAPNPGLMTGPGTNQYLLGVGDAPPVLLDAAALDAENERRLRAATDRLAGLVLTHIHPDHVGGVPAVRTRFAVPLAAHHSRADFVVGGRPLAPERALRDGDEIAFPGGRLTAVHAPGHESGHLCFHEPAHGWLFTGDTILSTGTTVIAPPDGDMRAYFATLGRLRALRAAIIFPGHGPPIHDPEAVIAQYLAHRELRERQVLAALAATPARPEDLVPGIYRDLAPGLAWAAAATVRAHLDKLAAEGRVIAAEDGTFRVG
jgi:glyoxylase-like metal-dependent hydrolase (beta-lactamase superfamily II)